VGEESDEIKKQIEERRAELGRHLNELEYRVKSATDVRAKFEENPVPMLGAAFGAGLLLALII